MSRYVDPTSESPMSMTPMETQTPTASDAGMPMGATSGSATHRFGSPVRDDSIILGGLADEDGDEGQIIDLSNGIRIEFLHRAGWPKRDGSSVVSPTASQREAANGGHMSNRSRRSGKRVSSYAEITLDYELLKAIDKVGGFQRYGVFDYASDHPLASRMIPGQVYEAQKDFSIKFVPSYNDCVPVAIQALNLAFPYLREGDDALIFAPNYLGPSILDPELGESFRPGRLYDETNGAYIEPASPPCAASSNIHEHSYIHVNIKRVYAEEALTEDRYITKTIIAEGKGGGTKLNFDGEEDPKDGGVNAASNIRRCSVGSTVTYDIGEVNEYLNKPAYFKTIRDFLVCGNASCDELDRMLLTMRVGEYSAFRVGNTRYHIKLLDIASGTAAEEVHGDKATELARVLKDAGNTVLSSGTATGINKAFASPVKPSRAGMGTPATSEQESLDLTSRYYPPPSDITPNPVLDSLSSYVVRAPRSSYLRCFKPTKAAHKDSHDSRVKDEYTYRALQLYSYAKHILTDAEGQYYANIDSGDDLNDNAASTSPARSPPTSSSTGKSSNKAIEHDKAKRAELLGTVFGNTAQVYLNLEFYEEAEQAATHAIKYCSQTDAYKQLFRRAKARKFIPGLIDGAIADLKEAEAQLKIQNVKSVDIRFEELRKELAHCESLKNGQTSTAQ